MANRFWVPGGNGNWSSISNWSTTSGGVSGAAVPLNTDDAFINALSGTSPTITLDVDSNVGSLDFTGAITPTFTGTSILSVFGNLTFISTLVFGNILITMKSSGIGKTLTTAGKSFTSFVVDAPSGSCILQDNMIINGSLALNRGTFDLNGKTVSMTAFSSSNSSVRNLTLGSAVVTCAGSWTATTSTNFTLSAGTSSITLSGNSSTFAGGGLSYNNVTLSGTPITITGSNTFNALTFTAGKTVNITSLTNQTVTSLVAIGLPSSKITIQSTSAGNAATITRSSGIQIIRNTTLKDITATGGATFYALGTTNVSGNSGWSYQMLIKQEKLSGSLMALYHIDSSGIMTKVSG